MGGKKLLEYAIECSKGIAIESFSSISNNPLLIGAIDDESTQTFNINVTTEIIDAPYNESYKDYILSGQDRNGVLRSAQQPKLTFMKGDTVKLYLDYDYTENPLGIFTYITELTDEQQITSTTEDGRIVITWRPIDVSESNYYYYRAKDNVNFMYNSITVYENPYDELLVDLSLSEMSIIGASEVSIYQNITLVFDDIVNIIENGGGIQFKNTDDNSITQEVIPSNTSTYDSLEISSDYRSYTFTLGLTRPLDFNANYAITIDDNVFQNIYRNAYVGLSDETVVTFSTEIPHPPEITSISPEHNSTNYIYFPIELSFNEVVYFGDGSFYLTQTNNDVDSVVYIDKNSSTGAGTQSLSLYLDGHLNTDASYSLQYTEGAVIDICNINIPAMTDVSHVFSTLSTEVYDSGRPLLNTETPSYPAHESTGNDINTNIILYFNRNMYLYTGYLYIIDIVGQTFHEVVVNVSNSSIITGDGTTTITIDPTYDFDYGKKYTVQFQETSLRDENYFFFNTFSEFGSVIKTEYPYEFSIKANATDPPQIVSMTPAFDTSNVAVDASFTIEFDENIYFNTGYIKIRNVDNINDYYFHDVVDDVDTYIRGSGTKTLEFTLKVTLDYDTSYSIAIDSSAIYDYEGNYFTDISNYDVFVFKTTPDIFPPQITTISPAFNQQDLERNIEIAVDFDDVIYLDSSSSFYLYDVTNQNIVEEIDISENSSQVSGNETTALRLTINTTLEYDTSYSLYMDPSAISDSLGNKFVDLSLSGIYVFHTAPPDITGPTITSISPDFNAQEILLENVSIAINFDENAFLDTSNNSKIYLDDVSSNTNIVTIDVSENLSYISGNGTTSFTIDISENLNYDTSYTLYMDISAITDELGNAFTDLSLSGTYQFKTIDRLTLVESYPSNNATLIDTTVDLSFVFNDDINLDSSNIVIYDLSNDEVYEIIDVSTNDSQLLIVDNILSIDLSNALQYDICYSVIFAPESIVNDYGTYFMDLSSENKFVFRTIESECLSLESTVYVIDGSYSFNTQIYDKTRKYGLYNGIYTLKNVPFENPIAILNSGYEDSIIYSVVSNIVITIKVSGGNTSANSNGDYYTFMDDNDNEISIADASYRFMRGVTYRFEDHGISTSHPFKIFVDGDFTATMSGGINGDNYIDIDISSNYSTTSGDLYYQCSNHTTMQGNLSLFYKEINEDNELGNGFYDFYHGDVQITISNEFYPISIYSFNNGYMGGKDILRYTDRCYQKVGFASVDISGAFRVLETNNWPNFDNFDVYSSTHVYGGNNVPSPRVPNIKIKVPLTPNTPPEMRIITLMGNLMTQRRLI